MHVDNAVSHLLLDVSLTLIFHNMIYRYVTKYQCLQTMSYERHAQTFQ